MIQPVCSTMVYLTSAWLSSAFLTGRSPRRSD